MRKRSENERNRRAEEIIGSNITKGRVRGRRRQRRRKRWQ